MARSQLGFCGRSVGIQLCVPFSHQLDGVLDPGGDVVAVEFVEGLAGLVRDALASEKVMLSSDGGRICPGECVACPMPKNQT